MSNVELLMQSRSRLWSDSLMYEDIGLEARHWGRTVKFCRRGYSGVVWGCVIIQKSLSWKDLQKIINPFI